MSSSLLGLDIGFKRTGVALSEQGIIAQPLEVIQADPPHMTRVIHRIVELVRTHEIEIVVAGVPYSEDGEINAQSNKVAHFLTSLRAHLEKESLSVDLVEINEFYSSKEAELLYPDVQLDAASATLILQEYINSLA